MGLPRTPLQRPAWALAGLLVGATLCPTVSLAGRKVDVGGHRLALYCQGKGTPVVVLDAGAGDTHQVWSEVQPRLARLTRTCSYDRAGLGKSDPGPMPRTSRRIAYELHALLRRGGEPGPYVLVGHSFGGLNARLFAATFPEDVAALVLVDATPPAYPEASRALLSRRERERRRTHLGVMPEAARSEVEFMETSVRQVAEAGALPPVPVIVLTAGARREPEPLRRLWEDLQRAMARELGARRQIVLRHAGHAVPFEAPDAVVRAVSELVEEVRGGMPRLRDAPAAGPAAPGSRDPGGTRG